MERYIGLDAHNFVEHTRVSKTTDKLNSCATHAEQRPRTEGISPSDSGCPDAK